MQLSAARGKLWEGRPGVRLGPLTVRTVTWAIPYHWLCLDPPGVTTSVVTLQNAAVPQRWFAHFYMVGAACNLFCALLYSSWCASRPDATLDQVTPVAV